MKTGIGLIGTMMEAKPKTEITTVEEFERLFGRIDLAIIRVQALNMFKYGGAFVSLEPREETLEDYDRKVGDRVKYEPGDYPEDLDSELRPGDVGTVVGIDRLGIVVRWDRIAKDLSIYNGELDDLGILEELADLASDKESFPMTKRAN